jgi:hypothetical protein
MPHCCRGNPLIALSPRPTAVGYTAPAQSDRIDPARPLLVFTVVVVAAALFLQRFGIPAGSKAISIVGPIGFAVAMLGVFNRSLSFNPPRLFLIMVMCLCAAFGALLKVTSPAIFTAPYNQDSLFQFLLLTSFAVLSFAYPIPERRFFRAIMTCLVIIAISGLLQFVAQFAGLRLFSFTGILPKQILYEDGYNLVIGLGIGSYNKSNGFFLLEPSIFSQFMAMGLIIEILIERRPWVLVLLAIGLVVSGSGTGWVVLASFVLSSVFSMGVRGIILSAVIIVVVTVILLGIIVLVPDVSGALTGRLDELTRPGTSGHMRFITPFWLLSDIVSRSPGTLLFGLGGGVSERLTMPYEYVVNTPVKIGLEYGVPALAAYVALFCVGKKTPVQRALTLPSLVLLMFTGGYQQFPPILFFVLLIISIASLTPLDAPPVPQPPAPARAGVPKRFPDARAVMR